MNNIIFKQLNLPCTITSIISEYVDSTSIIKQKILKYLTNDNWKREIKESYLHI